MVIASIVIGIALVVAGFSCIGAPIETFMRAAHLLAILLFVYGIYGIIRFFKRKALMPEFIVSLIGVAIGFIYLFRPGGTPPAGNLIGLDRFVLFIIAAFFLIKGIIFFSISIKTRFINRNWIWGFVTGLLSIILGIYCFASPAFAAATTGSLIGICFVESGFELLLFGLMAAYVTGAVNEVKASVASAVEDVKEAARNVADDIKADIAEVTGADEAAEAPVEEACYPEDAVDAAKEAAEAVEEAAKVFGDEDGSDNG